MISVFVYKDTNDFETWQWNAGPNKQNSLGSKPDYVDDKLICNVRSEPTPAMVLPPEDDDVEVFTECITKDSSKNDTRTSAMKKFIDAIRQKIGRCAEVSKFKDVPLCVFIHFGGEDYRKYNQRLCAAWGGLDDKNKQTFLCFAITRHGTSGGIINQEWIDTDADKQVLKLPDNNEQLLAVLTAGCKSKEWGIPLPPLFMENVHNTPVAEVNEQPKQQNGMSVNYTSSSSPSSEDNNNCNKDKGSKKERQSGREIQLDAKSALALRWMVFVELLLGFCLSWIKCFFVKSPVSEFGFAVLGLVFLIILVGILMKSHEKEPSSSSPNEEGNSKKVRKS